MPADDLSAPLKAKPGLAARLSDLSKAISGRARVRPMVALVGLFGLLAVSGILYINFHGSPDGGNPVAVISLQPTDSTGGQVDMAMRGAQSTEQPTPEEEPQSLPDAEPDNAIADTLDTGDGGARVIIIRPEEGIRETPLPSVPDNRLIERADVGLLPKRAEDGTAPMTVYARPHRFADTGPNSTLPRVAVLVNGMGLNSRQTSAAIQNMPADVSFAFAPYAGGLQKWVSESRQNGHEVFLQIPLEPFDFPDNDPGPHTLLSSLTPAENIERLEWLMSRMVGYAGITNFMGARFTASRESFRPILLEIKRRGLFYVDDGTSPRSLARDIGEDIGSQVTQATIVLDAVPAPDAITKALEQLEVAAYRDGIALGVISALPVSIETVSEWIERAEERGIEIVPVSATARAEAQG